RSAALALLFVTASLGSLAADWPGFRGSRGGVAPDKDLPVVWTKDNLLWKAKLPGPGASSPVVVGDRVFVTCYTGYGLTLSKGFGKKGAFAKGGGDAGDQAKLRLHLLCLDRATGQVKWQKDIDPKLPESAFNNFNREHGYASSTPVSDGQQVYVF